MSASANYSDLVQQIYVTYFGRPADFAAYQNFAAALAAANAPTTLAGLTSAYGTSDTLRTLIDSFGNSHESAVLYGAVTNDAVRAASFVTSIFNNLFNRAPASAGLSFWVDALLSGSLSPGNAALTIAAAATTNTTAQGALDAHSIANKTEVATAFTIELNTSAAAVAGYAGADAAAAARALLAGVSSTTDTAVDDAAARHAADTIAHPSAPPAPAAVALTGAKDTLTATTFDALLSSVAGASTLNAGDTLHGSGAAVLNIASDGSALPSAVAMDHIQTINIAATAGPGTVDVHNDTDVTALNITLAGGRGVPISTVAAAAKTAITITGTAGTAADQVTARSTSGDIHIVSELGHGNLTATSLDGDVTLQSGCSTGATQLSAVSTHGAVSIAVYAAATSGSYDITASSGKIGAQGIVIDVSSGIGSELYDITLGAHAGPALVFASRIGVGAQATAGSYMANTVIAGAQAHDAVWLANLPANTFATLGDQTAFGTLDDAIAYAHSQSGAGEVDSLVYGGNTYLVEDQVGTVAAANSNVIELLGVHTIGSVTSASIHGVIVTLAT